jgi:uncharacterized membrane protein
MSPVSVALVILSAAIHVGWNILTKSSTNPKIFSLLKGTYIIVATILLLPFLPLKAITVDVWQYIVLSGVAHWLYILALASAYETGDISFVYPIARSAPAFVPVAAYFTLGEMISFQGIVGIAVVVFCVLMLHLRGTDGTAGLGFRWDSFKKKESLWAFVTLATVVTYTIFDKAGMLHMSRIDTIQSGLRAPIFYIMINLLGYSLFWIYLALRRELTFKSFGKNEWFQSVIAALGTLISYSLILHVMQTETVSYIVTLRQCSILIAILAGWIFFKEKYGGYRLVVSVVMLVGLFLVATAE